jgi:hypothetical protein
MELKKGRKGAQNTRTFALPCSYNVADLASPLQAVRNAGTNSVVILGAWRNRATSRGG